MNISIEMKLEWDKDKESLTEFRKKWTAFQKHIEHQQILGILPRTDIKWRCSIKRKPVVLTDGTTYYPRLPHEGPHPIHEGGTKLEVGFI